MYFGAAWYPEHWPEERWPKDIELMKQANMNVMRIAEFAWSTMEPKEGKYDFRWLDKAIQLLADAKIDVVLGTPTATPPAWLTQKYPEVLAIEENGRPARHGNRCHYNPLSPLYLKFCRQITEKMARRYGKHPAVIGWQIDNEYNRFSYDPGSLREFQAWLKVKYKTLDNLNKLWVGSYWSEDYSDWSQIPFGNGGNNPGLRLEFQRFMTETYLRYQRNQVRIIRAHAAKRQWITSNFMGWFGMFDHYRMCEDLDMASYDSYWKKGTPDPAWEAVIHDLNRGFKHKNFWIMETQPNHVNWGEINPSLEPGRVRLRNWQAVAHGSESILYWQWRNPFNGQEQLHGSIIGQDGEPRACFEEIQRLGAEFKKATALLSGTSPRADIAVLNSYDARWTVEQMKLHKDFDYVNFLVGHARPFIKRNVTVDVISALASLDGYKLVVAPAQWLMEEQTAAQLSDFVLKGGHAVLTARSCAKDTYSRMLPMLPPGHLSEASGVVVKDFYLLENPVTVQGTKDNKTLSGRAQVWAERLSVRATDTKVLARFGAGNGWLATRPAVTTRKYGHGWITYIAAWMEQPLLDMILAEALTRAGVKPEWNGPEGVEFAVREGEGKRALIILNHTDAKHLIRTPGGTDILSGQKISRLWRIPPREVAVLELKK